MIQTVQDFDRAVFVLHNQICIGKGYNSMRVREVIQSIVAFYQTEQYRNMITDAHEGQQRRIYSERKKR